jgi:hypothetical protein
MNRLRLAWLLVVAGFVAAGAPADANPHAAPIRFSEPAAGSRLAAGAPAVAFFDLAGATLDGVDEMELVLSLDGGRTFPHRVSRDLPPGATRAVWTPPDLQTPHAVLGVRTGGRGREERVVAVSARFEIVAPAPEASPPAGGALAPRPATLGPSEGREAALEQVPAPSPATNGPSRAVPAPAAGPARGSRPSLSSGPLFLPRRE